MPKELEFDTVNKLYLELSQVVTATTSKELRMQQQIEFMAREIRTFVAKIRTSEGNNVPTDADLARLNAAAGHKGS